LSGDVAIRVTNPTASDPLELVELEPEDDAEAAAEPADLPPAPEGVPPPSNSDATL
jgi:hypothetical protein